MQFIDAAEIASNSVVFGIASAAYDQTIFTRFFGWNSAIRAIEAEDSASKRGSCRYANTANAQADIARSSAENFESTESRLMAAAARASINGVFYKRIAAIAQAVFAISLD
jgi:CRISPR/Cas system CSM-associated protein Csm5 (group 7 of RAMP superfamily)